ncbi:DUF3048 domain-containing protein [Eubacteriales bacterium OttesenSCG-928-A19]|nr:DUF3048 domain-containing protein [Eubacteriales bacterium OttesenSCG-928-A19]
MHSNHYARWIRRVLIMALALCMTGAGAHAQEAQTISPTTGLPTDRPYRPMLVVISNSKDAREPWGLVDADVVYEMLYWYPGHTRYFALYNDTHPQKVGSLRGARVFNAELQLGWDAVMLHHGGQDSPGTSIYDYFKLHDVPATHRIDSVKGGGKQVFARDETRVNPHNGYVNLEEAAETLWPTETDTEMPYESRLPSLRFSDEPARGDIEVHAMEIAYHPDEYRASYTYDPEEKLYLRAYNDVEQKDAESGERLAYANVIVQQNDLYYYENQRSRPVLHTAGAGPMNAFIDGTMIEGYWVRPRVTDPVQYYTNDGEVVVLRPGKTFIQMVTDDMFDSRLVVIHEKPGQAVYTNTLGFTSFEGLEPEY